MTNGSGEGSSPAKGRWAAGYLLALAFAVAAFLFIRHLGGGLAAPAPLRGGDVLGAVTSKNDALMHVLLALAVIIVTARAVGFLFAMMKQPPVIGEVIAGLVLGPSLLGRFVPDASTFLLPPSVAPFLAVLSQVGVLLYMFMVGLELDLDLVKNQSRATLAISHASIVVPFLLGSGLALLLYPRLSAADVSFTVFALFCGVAMSVTAFPVLARILTDRRLHKSPLGTVALTCAAVDDVTAWCLLAFVVSVANTRLESAFETLGLSGAFLVLMLAVVRPRVRKLVARMDSEKPVSKTAIALALVAVLISALATEWIGIHAIFGAFVMGAIVPHESALARELAHKLEDVVVILLLPAFFAYTGMRTQIGLVAGVSQWLLCGLVIAAASAGKFGGTLLAARLAGLGTRDAAALGILMNTRGLMELIVLNIGLDLKVISPTLFAMFVIMAVVTTLATTPILHVLARIN